MTQVIPETPANFDRTRIVERPDGIYWQDAEIAAEYGPYPSLVEAVADMQEAGSDNVATTLWDTLQEAESELGIADWIDPDTGGLAEDGVPHLEEH